MDIIHRTDTNYHFEDNDQDLPVCLVFALFLFWTVGTDHCLLFFSIFLFMFHFYICFFFVRGVRELGVVR